MTYDLRSWETKNFKKIHKIRGADGDDLAGHPKDKF